MKVVMAIARRTTGKVPSSENAKQNVNGAPNCWRLCGNAQTRVRVGIDHLLGYGAGILLN